MIKYSIILFGKWFFPILFGLFCIQIILGSFVFFSYSLHQTKGNLQDQIKRVKEDISYNNGQWNTSQYNADSDVPSSNPLYIITSDGFVIDRWKPIHGLLDASEFTRILTYSIPQTINTITNENWRVLSQPIRNETDVVGVILVTAYKPSPASLAQIDQQLLQTSNDIQKTISIQGEEINVSKLDPRKLPYNITYQIVNKFNKVITQSDNVNSITRTPTFIDASYVDNQLKAVPEEQITDSATKKKYLVETSALYNGRHDVIGVVVAGSEIDSLYTELMSHMLSFGGISLLLLVLFSPLFIIILYHVIKHSINLQVIQEPTTISFQKKESQLLIDTTSLAIAYASYQYYFCEALFSKPQKRWEVDEIIERFGDNLENDSWRKIYDTMIALNKKTSHLLMQKLFIVQDKTYRINPNLLEKIIA